MRMDKPDLSNEPDAELRETIEAFHRWYDHASLKEQAAWHRARMLKGCLRSRWFLRTFEPGSGHFEFGMKDLRRQQIQLLRIRIWRVTGVCPGEA